MSGCLLQVEGMMVRSRRRVLLNGLRLSVDTGRVTALVGPSGVGKSLAARCLMGLVDLSPGVVRGTLRYPEFSGERDWFELVRGKGGRGRRRLARLTASLRGAYVSYAPQGAASALNPARTLGRQMELAAQRSRRPVGDMTAHLCRLLQRVGLEPSVSGAFPSELSGGQCQRAALAIAMSSMPRLVIADEPETGLDPVSRRAVTELLVELCTSSGSGLLLISHNQDIVHRVAHHVVELPFPVGEAA